MDPITIGVTIGTLVISQLVKKLIEKAADPELVAKSVNWVFGAADNLIKIRRQNKPKETPIPAPPAPAVAAAVAATPVGPVSSAAVIEKTEAVKQISAELKQSVAVPAGAGLQLAPLDDFALEQVVLDIESCLKQLNTYLNNLRFEQEKVALRGGIEVAEIYDMNLIRLQQQKIAELILRMNFDVKKAYGVSASHLDSLLTVTEA